MLSLIFLFHSCDLFEDPKEDSPEQILSRQMPYSQYLISYWRGMDIGRFQLQWAQHLSGVGGNYLSVDRYDMLETHTNQIWYIYYNQVFVYLNNMLSLSEKIDSKAYRGITRVLHAYSLGYMTDTWGDIPYFDADGYMQGILPEYNEQQTLYFELLSLLELGIQDLMAAAKDRADLPGPDEDPIYKGDLQQWIKAANVIRLRHLLRLGNESGDYGLALTHVLERPGFTGINDDMIYEFDASRQQVNPHYFFGNLTRAGFYFVESLKAQDDPRLSFFLTKNIYGYYSGTAPGSGFQNTSTPGPALAAEIAPMSLISFTEQKFIEAEVYYRMGMQGQADAAYEDAVISSLRSFEIENPAWEAIYASVQGVDLEQIIKAKYLALFLNPEVYSDYRRTGYPDLAPYQEANMPEIPRRFLYAQDENQYNYINVPENVDLYTRMWWDKE